MKHTLPLGKGRFVTIDSYRKSHETRLWNLFIGVTAIAISSITIGAMLGIDITAPNPTPTHENVHRINR